jgi:hypothetical protein
LIVSSQALPFLAFHWISLFVVRDLVLLRQNMLVFHILSKPDFHLPLPFPDYLGFLSSMGLTCV